MYFRRCQKNICLRSVYFFVHSLFYFGCHMGNEKEVIYGFLHFCLTCLIEVNVMFSCVLGIENKILNRWIKEKPKNKIAVLYCVWLYFGPMFWLTWKYYSGRVRNSFRWFCFDTVICMASLEAIFYLTLRCKVLAMFMLPATFEMHTVQSQNTVRTG